MDLSLLKQSELFKKITAKELTLFSPLAREENHEAGSILFSQSGAAEKVFLLDFGMVALKTSFSEGLEITYEMITRPGDPFGWSALVAPFKLTATAICLEKSRVIAFYKKDLDPFFLSRPHLGYRVMQNLCVLIARRLHRTRQLLAERI